MVSGTQQGLYLALLISTPLVADTCRLVFTDYYNRHQALSTCRVFLMTLGLWVFSCKNKHNQWLRASCRVLFCASDKPHMA